MRAPSGCGSQDSGHVAARFSVRFFIVRTRNRPDPDLRDVADGGTRCVPMTLWHIGSDVNFRAVHGTEVATAHADAVRADTGHAGHPAVGPGGHETIIVRSWLERNTDRPGQPNSGRIPRPLPPRSPGRDPDAGPAGADVRGFGSYSISGRRRTPNSPSSSTPPSASASAAEIPSRDAICPSDTLRPPSRLVRRVPSRPVIST